MPNPTELTATEAAVFLSRMSGVSPSIVMLDTGFGGTRVLHMPDEQPKRPERPKLPEGLAYVDGLENSRVTLTVSADAPGFIPLPPLNSRAEPYSPAVTFVLYSGCRPAAMAGIYSDLDYVARYFGSEDTPIHVCRIPEGMSPYDYRMKEIDPVLNDNPWLAYDWFRDNALRWVEHLPRPSEKIEGLLAYFQTPEKRARDIRTPIKPGKYLRKFFSDVLTEEQIHEHALEWTNRFALRELHVTQDSDEIERVYKGAYLGSCMHFGNDNYAGDEHPARVYGGNMDLGIAYIGDTDSPEARCLVWPSKKIYFPKWYGDGPRLEASLKAAGYEAGDESDFDGARLVRIPYGSGFVVPYSDTHSEADDRGTHLVLACGDVDLRNTSGVSFEARRCEDCGECVSEDEITFVGPYEGRGVCPSCRDDDYFFCEGDETYHSDADRAPTPDGYAVSLHHVCRSSDWFFCEHTECYYPYNGYSEVSLVEGGYCVESYAEQHGFYCSYSEEWSLETDEKLELSDGRYVSNDSFSNRAELEDWLEREDVTLAGTDEHPDQIELPVAA